MGFQDCIKFANENPVCYFATVEGDQPRVRPIMMWFADDTGFYFQSQSVKAFAKQLKSNQKVEVCYFAKGRTMRITGKAEFVDDIAVRTRCYEERDIVKKSGAKSPEDPLFVVFRIASGEAFFWSPEYTMREAEIERVKF